MARVIELPGGCTPIPAETWSADSRAIEIAVAETNGEITHEEAFRRMMDLEHSSTEFSVSEEELADLVKCGRPRLAGMLRLAVPTIS